MSQITLIGADWCKPCAYLKANVQEWADSVKCDIPIVFEEYDSEKHCVTKLPTLTYSYDGLERQRIIGTDKTQIRVFLMNSWAYEQFSLFGYGD